MHNFFFFFFFFFFKFWCKFRSVVCTSHLHMGDSIDVFEHWVLCKLISAVPDLNDYCCTHFECSFYAKSSNSYRLITAYLLLRVNLDKIMHARWDFDASSARTRRVSALDKHQNWSASALFCLNSRAQSKYAVVNLIHTRRKQTFLSFIMG